MVSSWSRAQRKGVPGARARKRNARGAVSHPKPPWRLLYGIFIMGTGAVASVEFFIPASGTRMLFEAVIVVLTYGMAALWLHVYREHLSSEGREPAEAGADSNSNGKSVSQPPDGIEEYLAGEESDGNGGSPARFPPGGRRRR